jgi:hypothetical protein
MDEIHHYFVGGRAPLKEKAAALRRISLARFNSLISRSICFIFS